VSVGPEREKFIRRDIAVNNSGELLRLNADAGGLPYGTLQPWANRMTFKSFLKLYIQVLAYYLLRTKIFKKK